MPPPPGRLVKAFLIIGAFVLPVPGTTANVVQAQVVAYEGVVFPENDPVPWTRTGTLDAKRWVENGHFYQLVVLGQWPGPNGQSDGYKRTIGEFAGSPSFFVTWREMNTCPRSDMIGTPAGVTAWSSTGHDSFHFTVTRDQVRLIRDNPIGLILYVDIAPDVLHTYYLEMHNDFLFGNHTYTWYIDGIAVNSGQYPSVFPNTTAIVQWWARYYNDEQTAKWDYVRYGVIPTDYSGDFDRNGVVDANDLYFFVDCLLGPDYDAAGPGCKWADMNADGRSDGADIQAFVNAMIGS